MIHTYGEINVQETFSKWQILQLLKKSMWSVTVNLPEAAFQAAGCEACLSSEWL